MPDIVTSHLLAEKPAILDRFTRYLKIRSVSTDPAYASSMEEARHFLLARLSEIGLQGVRLLDAGSGQPAVYGEWLGAAGAPTLLIYAHYDVQPPGPADEWASPPFEPTERDGRIYARGASDVKGSTTIAIETIAAFLSVEGGCPVNVKLFLEGEEETGSPSLPEILSQFGDVLAADAVISADGGRGSNDGPTINVGMRGLARLEFTVVTADKDCHSGKYGGAIRNALHEIAALVASLHDRDGAVAVPGFGDDAAPITDEDRRHMAALARDEATFLADVGARRAGDRSRSIQERLTMMPCIDVNGLWGGYTGAGSMTIIPHRASAKLTMRLAPGQSPHKALDAVEAHLRARLTPGCRLEITNAAAGCASYTLPSGHPLVQSAQRVLRETTGREPVLMRHAATVPILSLFKERLGLDSLMFGFHLPDEDIHAPNEFFRLSSFDDGFMAWPLLLRELSTFAPEAMRG